MSEQPKKKAALPRRNKTGKRPITSRQWVRMYQAAIRTGRSRVIPRSGARQQENTPSMRLTSEGKTIPKKYNKSSNPGAGPASVADMQAMKRSGHTVRETRKKVKNVKGQISKSRAAAGARRGDQPSSRIDKNPKRGR